MFHRFPKICMGILGLGLAAIATESTALFDITFTDSSGLSPKALICLQGFGELADGQNATVLQTDGASMETDFQPWAAPTPVKRQVGRKK